jgi:hypothetical protein
MSSELATNPGEDIARTFGPTFVVPLEDMAEFSGIPEARRIEVQHTLRLLARLHALRGQGNIETAARTIAATASQATRGFSWPSLLRKYYAYLGALDLKGNHDWRILVKGYKGPSQLPEEFEQYVKRLAEENHRSMAMAWSLLRDHIWPSGQPVPGYGTWMEYHASKYPERAIPKAFPHTLYPPGWSQRNLYRKAPSKGARMLYQRGLAASKKHFPSVTRDPSQLRPLELIALDDFELDCLCVFPGDARHKPQVGRVAGLLAIDVATRRKLHWGLGQRMERDERQADGTIKTVRTGITRIDVQVLLHGIFAKFGLPPYQVTILCENAAASISPELQLSIEMLFSGRVKIERTGLIEHRTMTNGFVERGGKPWEKGWIESTFNQLWNILGAQRGYKGSNQRLNAPGDLDAKLRYTKLLIGQGDRALNLPPEKITELRLPFPSPKELEDAFSWACSVSDARTNHRYLGFDRVTEFQLEAGGEPQPLQALALLPPAQQLQVRPIERAESSVERWTRLTAEVQFAAIQPSVLAVFLLTPKRVKYANHSVTFEHNRAGYTYVDREGDVLQGVPDGTEFLGYFSPDNPELLYLTELNGARTGTLKRLGGKRGMVDIRDKDALADAAAVQATLVNRTLAEVRSRHVDEEQQLAADRKHNDAIVAAHKVETRELTPVQKIAHAAGDEAARIEHERRTQRGLQRAGNASEELLHGVATVPAAPVQQPVTPEDPSSELL